MTHTPRRLCFGLIATALLLGPALGLSTQAQTPPPETNPAPEPGSQPPTPDTPTPDTPTPDPQTSDTPAPDVPPDTASRFACEVYNGEYTVMYVPSREPDQSYPWAVPQDLGSAWPAQRRCTEISARLERYRPDGLLTLDTSVENGYNIVCVTTQAVPGCRIVFTVPPGQDAVVTRDLVFENLTLADQGQSTQGVNTFAEGEGINLGELGSILNLPGLSTSSSAINLKPFLAPADGGTGARLTGGVSGSPAAPRPLDPNNFR
ncbi:MAG: COP23 domain-containing protein [Nodosilinea sp.]